MMSNHNDINIGCLEFDPMETGRRIRSKRREMHLSLNGLAFCLAARGWDISVNSLGRWERGEVIISWDHALRLARFFCCQLDELVTYREREIDDERDQLVPFHMANMLQFQEERMWIAYVPLLHSPGGYQICVPQSNLLHPQGLQPQAQALRSSGSSKEYQKIFKYQPTVGRFMADSLLSYSRGGFQAVPIGRAGSCESRAVPLIPSPMPIDPPQNWRPQCSPALAS